MQDPSVYSMETHEIVNKLEHIVTGEIPNTQEWQNQSVQDLVVKYKVRLVHLWFFTMTTQSSTKE